MFVLLQGIGAADVNVMALTAVSSEIEASIVLERSRLVTLAAPLGPPFGVQLSAAFQSHEIGSRCPLDLIAHVTVGIRSVTEQPIATKIHISTVISGFVTDAIDYCRSKLARGKAH
jgi:hypothetical protein